VVSVRFTLSLLLTLAALLGRLQETAMAAPPVPADQTAGVNVAVVVGQTFTIVCDQAVTALVGNPGIIQTIDVSCLAISNYSSSPWKLQIQVNQALTDALTGEAIPLANFTHTSTGGEGVHNDPSGSPVTFTTTPTTYYTAASNEKNNFSKGGTRITSTYRLVIPPTQAAGSYIATVTHILTVNL